MTAHRLNEYQQPIGLPLPGWTPPPVPPHTILEGRFCRLEPLDPTRHAEPLFAAFSSEPDSRIWTYLPYGPFETVAEYRDWLATKSAGGDPLFYVICAGPDFTPVGIASYLRITPASGSIEVGHLVYSSRLRRSPAATEAMFLMMQHAFELGYRRYEWKCDALNAPSRAAAQRLGLSYEGIFRQATVYKERTRDTAWFAAINAEWPALKAAFETWLAPDNFTSTGQQRLRLSDLTRPVRKDAPGV